MSHTKNLLFITLLLTLAVPVSAQRKGIDEVVRPPKRQQPAFYFKAYYNSPDLNFISNIKDDINRTKAMGVLSHSSIGFAYRIPIWQSLYIQPEFQYNLVTNWDSASLRRNFFSQIAEAFNTRYCSNFDIPVNIGVRWEPARIFAVRAYAGAMIRFCHIGSNFELYDNYCLRAGVGLDLLNLLCIDAGFSVEMNKLTIYDDTALYFLALGIKL